MDYEHLSSTLSTSLPNLDNLVYLPDETYHAYIFDQLNIDQLLQLKLNSKFSRIIQPYNIEELAFSDEFYLHKDPWFSTNTHIKYKDYLCNSKLTLLKNPQNKLLNLKRLAIKKIDHSLICLDDLNKFRELEILEIIGLKSISNKLNEFKSKSNVKNELNRNLIYKIKLELPYLKALRIGFGSNKFGSLAIDKIESNGFKDCCLTICSKNLHSLSILNNPIEDPIALEYPEAVEYIQLANCAETDISELVNLKTLDLLLHEDSDLEIIDVQKLNHLKKLRLYYDLSCLENSFIDTMKEKFILNKDFLEMLLIKESSKIMSKCIMKLIDLFKAKNDTLEMIFEGVKIHSVDKFKEFKGKPILQFQIDNFKDLEENLNFKQLLYSRTIPRDLFKKYSNIQFIVAIKVKDSHLLRFIEECYNLSGLHFVYSALDQTFCNKLFAIKTLSNTLSILAIANETDELNFEFVMNLKYLTHLFTDLDILKDGYLNLNCLKYLKNIVFKIKHGKVLDILKKDTDNYIIDNEHFSLDKMRTYCGNLRSKSLKQTLRMNIKEMRSSISARKKQSCF